MGINTDIITIKKFIDLKKNAISAANKSDHITYIDGKYYVFGNQSYILNPLKKEKIISMLIENTDGDTLPIDIFLKNKILRGELSAFISFPFLTGINTQFKTTINDRPTHDDNFVLMMNKLINIFVENDDETSIKEEEQIINQDILNIKEIFYSYLTK
jgi:hypothetical protein